jgi:hypothetical protein
MFAPFNDPAIARHHDLIDVKKAQQNLFNQDRKLYNQLFSFSTGSKKYNAVSITPPRHMNWVMGQSSRKASLTFSILPERITKALGQEISQVKLLGKDKNAYAQHDFSSVHYQGRELNFTVTPFNDPASDRHGDPIVYMQNPGDGNYYCLAMFARESSKLPINASFQGQVFESGTSVDLYIKPGSIVVPVKEMPQSPKKQISKARRQEKSQVQSSNKSLLASLKNRHSQNKQNAIASSKKQNMVANVQFAAPEAKNSAKQLEM